MRLYVYYFSFVLGLILAVLSSMRLGKKLGTQTKDAAVYTVMGFSAGVIGAILMSFFYNAVIRAVAGEEPASLSKFSLYGGLLFVPVLLLLPMKAAKKDMNAALDVCCTGVYLLLGTAKLGCHVYGCCYGIPVGTGVVNPQTGETVFPVQLLEAGLTFLLAAVIYRYTLKEKRPKGSVYPLGLILYGCMRFCIQFLRYHEYEAEKHLLLFMDTWQTVSLAAVVCGGIWLFVLKNKTRRNA